MTGKLYWVVQSYAFGLSSPKWRMEYFAVLFLWADTIVSIGLVVFCVKVIDTVLKGRIAVWVQMSEPEEGGLFKAPSDVNDSGRIDLIPMVNLPPSTR